MRIKQLFDHVLLCMLVLDEEIASSDHNNKRLWVGYGIEGRSEGHQEGHFPKQLVAQAHIFNKTFVGVWSNFRDSFMALVVVCLSLCTITQKYHTHKKTDPLFAL